MRNTAYCPFNKPIKQFNYTQEHTVKKDMGLLRYLESYVHFWISFHRFRRSSLMCVGHFEFSQYKAVVVEVTIVLFCFNSFLETFCCIPLANSQAGDMLLFLSFPVNWYI